MNEKKHRPNRIPIKFMDEETPAPPTPSASSEQDDAAPDDERAEGDLTPEEIGRASIYEDATEVRRRIERGGQEDDTEDGRQRADDADIAGSLDPSEITENREDTDTKRLDADDSLDSYGKRASGGAGNSSSRPDASASRQNEAAAGPVIAELVATRAELRRVEGALEKAEAERHDLLDRLARRQADFDNYRKRVERERGETHNRIIGEVVRHLFPVIDNLGRALDAESSIKATESEEFRHFLQGIELIQKQIGEVLTQMGVEPVASIGERFDPHVHEAIATEQTDEFEPDTVIEEIVRGYRIGDKLLRPAMVKVATK